MLFAPADAVCPCRPQIYLTRFRTNPRCAVPEELIFKYGYGYARYALRPADCQLRLAYSVALHELWGAGVVSNILKKYGLSNRNLTYFPLD